MGTGPTISVIIPTLNESVELPETLSRVQAVPEIAEIIVVDAGSSDSTCEIARDHNCTLRECEPSRGRQLRLGAKKAKGDIILLLHADTWLPKGAGEAMIECLSQPLVVGGGFRREGAGSLTAPARLWSVHARTELSLAPTHRPLSLPRQLLRVAKGGELASQG